MNDINKDNLIFKILPSFTHPFITLIRLDRPIGFLLLFYPVSFAIVSYGKIGLDTLKYLIIFFIGAFVMRSAGCIINDIFDRNIDKKVNRTKLRPLASNQITLTNAITLLLILFIIGFYILTNLNIPSIILGLVISPLIILYPLAKRYFIFPQLVLAMIYNWGCLIGWVTIQSPYEFSNILILYFALIIWTIVYDTIYAIQDEIDDKKMKLYSSVIFLGKRRFQAINILIILKYALLSIFAYSLNYHFIFYIIVFSILIVNLLDINLKWRNLPENSLAYFKRNNHYALIILFSIMIGSQLNV